MLHAHNADQDAEISPLFGRREMSSPVPRYRLPDGEMPPRAAYQLIHDELSLDGNPLLNLASFVTTWMEPEARMLFDETLDKNFIDEDEYPQTSEVERRCVSILADLFHAHETGSQAMGTSTIGSSEAIHLGALALKWNWRSRRAAAGKPTDKPNLVMGSHVHVVWEKFCRYFDVEPRFVPLSRGRYALDVEQAVARVDDNTIGVVAVLGSTYTGHFDDVASLDAALGRHNDKHGYEVPIHVDGASGAFVAAFCYPDLAWDFRLPLVRSINTSGHKYGLVYPGVGWAIWRDRSDLPGELVFHDNYLGNDQMTFDFNFSKAASQVIGQYYNFLRLGKQGYRRILTSLMHLSGYVRRQWEAVPGAELISGDGGLPLVCGRVGSDAWNAHDVAAKLRQRGWIVPAYTMPADITDMCVLRVVIREGFSRDMADNLIADAGDAIRQLNAHPPATPLTRPAGHAKVC